MTKRPSIANLQFVFCILYMSRNPQRPAGVEGFEDSKVTKLQWPSIANCPEAKKWRPCVKIAIEQLV